MTISCDYIIKAVIIYIPIKDMVNVDDETKRLTKKINEIESALIKVNNKLDNKVAVITGAAGGIGRAAAKLFAQEGAKLMLVDLDETNLLSMVEEIGSDQASYVTADVSNVNDVKNYIDKTLSIFKKIDITLLNAGIEGKIASIQDQTDGDFDKVLAVNVRGVWLGA